MYKSNKKRKRMSMTLEMVAARVAILEKQMADLMSEEKPKKETKKEKKEAKVKTDEPKKEARECRDI